MSDSLVSEVSEEEVLGKATHGALPHRGTFLQVHCRVHAPCVVQVLGKQAFMLFYEREGTEVPP